MNAEGAKIAPMVMAALCVNIGESSMINRNSPAFIWFVDYIAIPSLFLIIIVYCSLIFLSRSYLGVAPTTVLIGLGTIALLLLSRSVIHSKKLKNEQR